MDHVPVTPKDHSKPEPSTIVLRRDRQQALEAATHRFLRTEAATLRDPFDRQARVRQQAPRRVNPEPLDGAGRRLPGCLRIAPTETALAHPGLIGQDRE